MAWSVFSKKILSSSLIRLSIPDLDPFGWLLPLLHQLESKPRQELVLLLVCWCIFSITGSVFSSLYSCHLHGVGVVYSGFETYWEHFTSLFSSLYWLKYQAFLKRLKGTCWNHFIVFQSLLVEITSLFFQSLLVEISSFLEAVQDFLMHKLFKFLLVVVDSWLSSFLSYWCWGSK